MFMLDTWFITYEVPAAPVAWSMGPLWQASKCDVFTSTRRWDSVRQTGVFCIFEAGMPFLT